MEGCGRRELMEGDKRERGGVQKEGAGGGREDMEREREGREGS